MKRRVLIGMKFNSRMTVAKRRAMLVVGFALSRSSSAAVLMASLILTTHRGFYLFMPGLCMIRIQLGAGLC
jgi:hypothetical protein